MTGLQRRSSGGPPGRTAPTRRGHPFLPLVLSVAPLAGCTESTPESADAPAFTTRDSAGVPIAESRAPAWAPGGGWTISGEPALEIGTLEGEDPYLFEGIAGATRLPDGRIVLVEERSREIRVFDAAGSHLASIGGRGEGPGEFAGPPDVVVLPGDTLLAYDPGSFRYSWFTLDGRLIRDAPFDREASRDNLGGAFSRERRLFPDGSFFNVGGFAPSNTEMSEFGGFLSYAPVPDEIARSDIRLGIVPAGGGPGVVFGRFPWDESGYVEGETIYDAFRVTDHFHAPALYATGRGPVRVHIATPGAREIRTLDASGALLRIVRQTLPLEPLTEAMIAAERAAVRDSVAARNEATRSDPRREGVDEGPVLDLFDRIAFPDSVFPWSGLEADAEGDLWALEHRVPAPADGTRTYQVFDATGRWLGPVRVPASVGSVEEIGPDYVLGIWTDELEVPYLRVYGIEKGGG